MIFESFLLRMGHLPSSDTLLSLRLARLPSRTSRTMTHHCTFDSIEPTLARTDEIFRIDPFNFIYYCRHSKSSMRFHAAEVDAPGLPPVLNEVKTPVEVSLACDFTRSRDIKHSVPEYQLVVNLVSSVQPFTRFPERWHTVERSKVAWRSCGT